MALFPDPFNTLLGLQTALARLIQRISPDHAKSA
jgi:hypothetical protein